MLKVALVAFNVDIVAVVMSAKLVTVNSEVITLLRVKLLVKLGADELPFPIKT